MADAFNSVLGKLGLGKGRGPAKRVKADERDALDAFGKTFSREPGSRSTLAQREAQERAATRAGRKKSTKPGAKPRRGDRTKNITFRVTPTWLQELREYARACETSATDVVEQAVRDYIASNPINQKGKGQ